jgi:hypothetical protein
VLVGHCWHSPATGRHTGDMRNPSVPA